MRSKSHYRIFAYLKSVADRAFFEKDDSYAHLREFIELKLPSEITDIEEFKQGAVRFQLQAVAVAASAAMRVDCLPTTKPGRVTAKVETLERMLDDRDVWIVLATNMGMQEASDTIGKLKRGMRDTKRPRKLTAVDIGHQVADILRTAGLPINASETGLLARTLACIRDASGFPTNARETPSKLKM